MTPEQKVRYMKLALTLAGLRVDDAATDMIIQIYESVVEKQDGFCLGDVSKIIADVEQKYNIKPEKK